MVTILPGLSQTFQTGLSVEVLFGAQIRSQDPAANLIFNHMNGKDTKIQVTRFDWKNVKPSISECQSAPTGNTATRTDEIEAFPFANYTELDACALKGTPIFKELRALSADQSATNRNFLNSQLFKQLQSGFIFEYADKVNDIRWFGDTQLNPATITADFDYFVQMDGFYTRALTNTNTVKVAVPNYTTAFAPGEAYDAIIELVHKRGVAARSMSSVVVLGYYFAQKLWDDLVEKNAAAVGVSTAFEKGKLEQVISGIMGIPFFVSETWDLQYAKSKSTGAVSADVDNQYDSILTGKYPKLAMIAPLAANSGTASLHELDLLGTNANGTVPFYTEFFKGRDKNGLMYSSIITNVAAEFGTQIIAPTRVAVCQM
jgi:hypothetical protein